MKNSQLTFWAHFLVATIGHLFLIIIPVGLFKLLWNTYLDFWTKGLILGTLYIGIIYSVNHISSGDLGFCWLTYLENYYREQEHLPQVSKRFMPRYYKKWTEGFNWIKRLYHFRFGDKK